MKFSLTTLLWLLAFGLLGGSVLYFLVTVGSLNFTSSVPKTGAPAAPTAGTAASSFSGTLLNLDLADGNLPKTYRLIDDSGKVVAYLESRNIDLRILVGKKLTVEGKRQRMVSSGLPLVSVEKVNLGLLE